MFSSVAVLCHSQGARMTTIWVCSTYRHTELFVTKPQSRPVDESFPVTGDLKGGILSIRGAIV